MAIHLKRRRWKNAPFWNKVLPSIAQEVLQHTAISWKKNIVLPPLSVRQNWFFTLLYGGFHCSGLGVLLLHLVYCCMVHTRIGALYNRHSPSFWLRPLEKLISISQSVTTRCLPARLSHWHAITLFRGRRLQIGSTAVHASLFVRHAITDRISSSDLTINYCKFLTRFVFLTSAQHWACLQLLTWHASLSLWPHVPGTRQDLG